MMLFRIGWWVLVVSTGLFALNHVAGTAAFATSDDERMMFLVFAALQLLALIVLLVPYRARDGGPGGPSGFPSRPCWSPRSCSASTQSGWCTSSQAR